MLWGLVRCGFEEIEKIEVRDFDHRSVLLFYDTKIKVQCGIEVGDFDHRDFDHRSIVLFL